MRSYQPSRCRPVEICNACRQPWPCEQERARVAARRRAREAVRIATEAALLITTETKGGGNE